MDVIYHGSRAEAHGPAVLLDFCAVDCVLCRNRNPWEPRAVLLVWLDGRQCRLHHVRHTSYTPAFATRRIHRPTTPRSNP